MKPHPLTRVGVISLLSPGSIVRSPATLTVEVVIKQTRQSCSGSEGSGSIVRQVNVIDRIAVTVRRRLAGRAEPIDEVQETSIAVGTGGVCAAAGDGVVAVVLDGAEVGDLLALVILKKGFATTGDHGLTVLLIVGGVVGEAFGPVVVSRAVGVVDRPVGAQPDHRVRVGGPEGDGDAAGFDVGESGVSLNHLEIVSELT